MCLKSCNGQRQKTHKHAEAKAMILSVWDKDEQNAMRIDLWTKEMQVDEMKQFVHQTILTLADSFEKADE
jgi:gliding motility-associated protein GldC